ALALGRNRGQVDVDGLVVALALAGEVVTGVLDRPVRAPQVVVEDEVLVGDDLSVAGEHQRGRVQVEVGAGGGAHVPATTHGERAEVGRGLGQREVGDVGA